MASKTIIFLGLFLAMVLLISSEVAARDLAETSNSIDASKAVETTDDVAVNDEKDRSTDQYGGGGYPGGGGGGYPGGGGGYPGGGGGGYPGGGGGGYPGRGGGGYPGRGGGGYPGRGGGGYPGRGGGGGYPGRGGGCRYGCCGGGRYNGCRCCSYAGEKVNVETNN